MIIFRIWLLLLLLTLTAVALSASLAAEEINAPQPHWHEPAAAQSAPPAGDKSAEAAVSTSTPDTLQRPTAQPPAVTTQSAAAPTQTLSQHEKAEQQLKEQEKQRVMGIVPAFNVSYESDAASLTRTQKIRLALRTSIDPVTFGIAMVAAGYHEADNDQNGFPWGAKGYGERAGAAYLDTFSSNMIGNGILPALLHQDPRYFRMGHGRASRRLFYAVAAAFVCKHDNTGKWEPNYSNVAGNIASGALSNVYYPANDSGVGLAVTNGLIVTAEGAFGAIFQEFWPDVSRKFFHRDPTNGRDARLSAAPEPATK